MNKTILYCRCSTIDQKTDRQRINEKDYDYVIEDKVSGAVPFFERPGGKEIMKLVENKVVKALHIWSVDRAGRNLADILHTLQYFTKNGIAVHFVSQGLTTLDEKGKENPVAKMVLSVMGSISELHLNIIREAQREGVHLAKLKGIYKGRMRGSKEDVLKFLGKEKNKKALELLKKGYKSVEIEKIVGININTITKIKKLGIVG